MKGLFIDPEARTAWAQPGLTAGEYTVAAAVHGLATPFGDTASVGIGGLTLGGGIGWLVRKFGLAIDALLAVEIVTADGRQVTASPETHPDLFWAVRGGGGNFGVVTRFQFRLYPVGVDLGGASLHAGHAGGPAQPRADRAGRPRGADHDLVPDACRPPVRAAEHVGKLSVIIMFLWVRPGSRSRRTRAIPTRSRPALRDGHADALPGIYQMLAEVEKRAHGVHWSRFLTAIDDDAVDQILRRWRPRARLPR
jgi:FAD/FMN-containing dehydrogenase